MSVISSYFEETNILQNKYGQNSLVLMMVGSFYEVYAYKNELTGEIYGSNIETFSKICDMKISPKSGLNAKKSSECVLMAGFPEYQLEKYLSRLQEHGMTIAIVNQTKLPDGKITRKVEALCSPGTHFSLDETSTLSNVVMCIRLYRKEPSTYNPQDKLIMGMASLDVITGHVHYTEHDCMYRHDPASYDFLERIISIERPSEVIILYDNHQIQDSELDEVITFMNIQSSQIHKVNLQEDTYLSSNANRCEKQNVQANIIEKYYPNNDVDLFMEEYRFNEHRMACHAFVMLLDFVHEHNPNLIEKIRLPTMEFDEKNVYLGNHSLRQLNIISDNRYKGKKGSVIDFINNCVTPMGKRMLKNNVLHPLIDKSRIEERYDMVEAAIADKQLPRVRQILGSIEDIDKMFRSISMKSSMRQMIQIRDSLLHVVSLIGINPTIDTILSIAGVKDSVESIQTFLQEHFNENYGGESPFEHVDDIDAGTLYTMNCFSSDKYPDIYAMEQDYIADAELLHAIRNELAKIITKECGVKKSQKHCVCRFHYTDKSGFFLKASNTRGNALLKYVKQNDNIRITSGQSDVFVLKPNMFLSSLTSGEKKITSPELDELIVSCRHKKEVFLAHTQQTLDKVMTLFKEFHKDIHIISHYVAMMDCSYGNAKHAMDYHYCRPRIEDAGHTEQAKHTMIDAKQLRHPLIEVLQTRETYVANDIIMGKEQTDGMLIFGTNAVGKSSLIKSIGVALILAQSGCFVPASSFEYVPCKKLFTRILGNDNIFKGLSTFAVEMSELNMILRNADKDTIVLGDELCSGTEMGSAISIFVSGLQYLSNVRTKFMFATHFHEIVNMKQVKCLETLSIKHLSVEYDKKEDMLIYNRVLQDGPGNNLYGLEVCKSLHLPDDFLNMANSIRLERFPDHKGISGRRTSRYNSNKIKINCELCGNESSEVHHMKHQSESDERGFIGHVHKNHMANLLSICHECHDRIHKEDIELKKVKTTKGHRLIEQNKNKKKL